MCEVWARNGFADSICFSKPLAIVSAVPVMRKTARLTAWAAFCGQSHLSRSSPFSFSAVRTASKNDRPVLRRQEPSNQFLWGFPPYGKPFQPTRRSIFTHSLQGMGLLRTTGALGDTFSPELRGNRTDRNIQDIRGRYGAFHLGQTAMPMIPGKSTVQQACKAFGSNSASLGLFVHPPTAHPEVPSMPAYRQRTSGEN